MNNEAIKQAIETGDKGALVDLNDLAVGEVRDYCDAQGYDADVVFAEESSRIEADGLGFVDYLKTSRAGSRFRLSRRARASVWNAVATRVALRK